MMHHHHPPFGAGHEPLDLAGKLMWSAVEFGARGGESMGIGAAGRRRDVRLFGRHRRCPSWHRLERQKGSSAHVAGRRVALEIACQRGAHRYGPRWGQGRVGALGIPCGARLQQLQGVHRAVSPGRAAAGTRLHRRGDARGQGAETGRGGNGARVTAARRALMSRVWRKRTGRSPRRG